MFFLSKRFKLNMTKWPCHVWLQKSYYDPPTSQSRGCYQLLYTNLGDGVLCTLSPNHNIHGENGVYQQWTTYALKSKSVSEKYFLTIWRSKFTDLVNSKKTQSRGKIGCRQKCLDKSLYIYIYKNLYIYIYTDCWFVGFKEWSVHWK